MQDGHSFHLGLAYVAAILRQHGLAVSILDCFAEGRLNVRADQDGWREVGLSNDAILRRVRALAPDLIGISIPFSCQHYVAQEVIRLVKTALPETIVVVGGNHVTAVPERIDPSHVDYFVIGEGEYALLRLVQALNAGGPTDGIPGVTPKGAQGCLPPEYIEPLDDLPFPALDLLPLTKIWQGGRRWINMVATRGCVYECNFCSIHTIMGYRIRRRSIDNVVAEIRHWKTQYNIQEVYFEDDNLTTNRKWAKAFFRRLAGERFGIRFYARNGIRADSIDRELLVLMKAAGFHDFMIAPETGSQATLDTIIGKRMRLEDCTRAVDLAREVGLGINAFFVFGFPGETWEDIQTTLRYAQFLKERGCVGFWLSLATPYPGTRLFKQCLEQGVIPADMDYRHFRTVDYLIQNPNYTARELKAFRQRAMQMLAPPRLSLLQKMWKGFTLLRRDPNFFWVKVRYKLGAYL